MVGNMLALLDEHKQTARRHQRFQYTPKLDITANTECLQDSEAPKNVGKH